MAFESLKELLAEREEIKKDYIAFSEAYDKITQRLRASIEVEPPRTPLLHTWSGARAACGSLEMAIGIIQQMLDAYDELIRKVKRGEIENTDQRLTLVKD